MSVRTPLGQVEGLGAAHRGTEHFISQRVTAIALVPLAIWFVFSAFALNAILMALFVIAALMHMVLGLQVVIEDYVTSEAGKIVLLVLNKFFAWAVGAAVIYALLKITFMPSTP
jgi:succinate dehydrogenase / fumarate reductase membrane anchor subunit